jgi:hypothetical protein
MMFSYQKINSMSVFVGMKLIPPWGNHALRESLHITIQCELLPKFVEQNIK